MGKWENGKMGKWENGGQGGVSVQILTELPFRPPRPKPEFKQQGHDGKNILIISVSYDFSSLLHIGQAANSPPASLLPCQGEFGITVFTVHGVDTNFRGAIAKFHDTAAALFLPGHRPRSPCQVVRIFIRNATWGF